VASCAAPLFIARARSRRFPNGPSSTGVLASRRAPLDASSPEVSPERGCRGRGRRGGVDLRSKTSVELVAQGRGSRGSRVSETSEGANDEPLSAAYRKIRQIHKGR
jgi:hypothetical protein